MYHLSQHLPYNMVRMDTLKSLDFIKLQPVVADDGHCKLDWCPLINFNHNKT